jgi:dihydroflavonol-4-reductase
MWFRDMARLLKAAHPDRKISTRQAPNWFIRLYALFDPAVGQIVASLGKHIVTDNSRARSVLGIEFISAQEATTAAADFLVANDLVG